MLAVSFDEVKKEDIEKHKFAVLGSVLVRFCIDISHSIIGFCEPTEDHIIGALTLLSIDQNIENLSEQQQSQAICNHIIGGTLYLNTNDAYVITSGTSIEQQLQLLKLGHSKESLAAATEKAVALFQKFYKKITYKIVHMPQSL